MSNHYQLLKSTVSQLIVFSDEQEMRSDHIGFITFIGLTLLGLMGSAANIIGSLTSGSVKIAGQGFCCYIGSKWVKGKLANIDFNDGDYIEVIVKTQKNNTYKAYAVRIPQQHAYFFPKFIGTTTLQLLKYCSIFAGRLALFGFIVLLFVSFFYSISLDNVASSVEVAFYAFIIFLFMSFFMFAGHYSFLSNKIYAIWGHPKSWLYNSAKEELQFKKMNRSGDPILFDDPQTPDFKKLTKYNPYASYYCRTPILPDWVKVIDERGLKPKNNSNTLIIEDKEL